MHGKAVKSCDSQKNITTFWPRECAQEATPQSYFLRMSFMAVTFPITRVSNSFTPSKIFVEKSFDNCRFFMFFLICLLGGQISKFLKWLRRDARRYFSSQRSSKSMNGEWMKPCMTRLTKTARLLTPWCRPWGKAPKLFFAGVYVAHDLLRKVFLLIFASLKNFPEEPQKGTPEWKQNVSLTAYANTRF